MIRRFPVRALGAALFVLSLAAPALAQPAPSPSPSASPLATIVHVTTADRSDHTLKNTARTTYVVTADQIAKEGLRNIAEALAAVPGVETSSYGALGAATSFGIRGSSSAQVLVLINGMPAPGNFSNSVDLSALSTLGVKQIEVVEGGGSTLYGTGAIGGIINVITDDQHAPDTADARYGSFGDRELAVGADGLSFQRILADNIFPLPGDDVTRNDDDYEYTDLGYNYKTKIGKIDASFNASESADHLGTPGDDQFGVSPTARESDVNGIGQFNFGLHRAQSLTTLQFGGTRQQLTYGCDMATDPNCFTPLPTLDTESRVDISLRNAVTGDNEQLLYGVDLSRGVARGDSGTPAVAATSTTAAIPQIVYGAIAQAAIYAQESVSFHDGGHAYLGLRGERDGSYGGALAPSVGFVEPVAPNVSLKLNYATAFRAPDFTSLYFPDYGNPSLQPERAAVGDATLEDIAFAGGARITWFTNRTNDLIVPVLINTTTYEYQAQNVDHALMQGFTGDVSTKPVNGVFAKLALTDLYRAQDIDAQQRLPHDPVINATLTLGILGAKNGTFKDAGISVSTVGQSDVVDFNAPLYDQAVTYTNLGAYLQLRAGNHLVVSLRGANLGDQRYAAIAGYPAPGRAFALELGTH